MITDAMLENILLTPCARGLQPYVNLPRTALERLSVLSQRSTWREPVGGRSTAPGSPTHDMLRALSAVTDQLGAETALAMACLWTGNWKKIVRLAALEFDVQGSELAACGHGYAWPYRVRLVLFDSFHDLVTSAPATRARGAKRVGMRRNDYTTLHTRLTYVLERRAFDAAREAIERLRADKADSYGVVDRAA